MNYSRYFYDSKPHPKHFVGKRKRRVAMAEWKPGKALTRTVSDVDVGQKPVLAAALKASRRRPQEYWPGRDKLLQSNAADRALRLFSHVCPTGFFGFSIKTGSRNSLNVLRTLSFARNSSTSVRNGYSMSSSFHFPAASPVADRRVPC